MDFAFVQRFVELYLDASRITKIVSDAGYVPLEAEIYHKVLAAFNHRLIGSRFNGPEIGVSVEELLARQPR
jgi:hypothetical protein